MTTPGWYPDPADPARLRLWDGTAWTDQTQPVPAEALAATPVAETTPPPPAVPGAPSPDGRPLGNPPPAAETRRVTQGLDASRITTALAVAVAIIAMGISIVLLATNDDEPPQATTDVRLEPAAAPGPNAFSDPLGPEAEALRSGELGIEMTDSDGVKRVVGSTPRLFGTSANPSLCNLDALAFALAADPAKASAFAGAVGVPAEQLGVWLAGLTTVILREDTRVTNHGFIDGRAAAFQSVLQAGTVVAVDSFGAPKVRCACGNPLAPPRNDIVPAYTGEAWENFAPDGAITIVTPNEPVAEFELNDVVSNEPVRQPPGRRLTLSATSVLGVPFGTDKATAVQLLTPILGPPTLTDPIECTDPGLERSYALWGTFGVRFEFGFLDAWALSPSLTPDPGGLPANVDVIPIRPGMTLAEAEAALATAKAREPQGWLVGAPDSGVVFSELGSSWRRSISGLPPVESLQFGQLGPSILLFLTGNDPQTSLVDSVIVTGAFTPPIAPPSLACFGSDIPF